MERNPMLRRAITALVVGGASFALTACGGGGGGSSSSNDGGGPVSLQSFSFPSNGSFFTDTDYLGAVDPNLSGDPWWQGWIVNSDPVEGESKVALNPSADFPLKDNYAETQTPNLTPNTSGSLGNGCPSWVDSAQGTLTIEGKNFPVCKINGTETSARITQDRTLDNGRIWLIDGVVNVGNGFEDNSDWTNDSNFDGISATLTIEEGTQILADPGATSNTSALVINRGSEIQANGSKEAPIVMSSADTNGNTGDLDNNYGGQGEWGGLVVTGFGVHASNAGGQVDSEAVINTGNRKYAGNDPGDSSGSISYMAIAESGSEFRTDEEVQGLTLEAVGGGSTFDHINVANANDDGIEFFGGTVNVKYAVITGVRDDSLDMDAGYAGGIQFAIAKQGPEDGNRTIESDSKLGNNPPTLPTVANLTLIGDRGLNESETTAALHREGMGGFFYNSIYTSSNESASAAGDAGYESGCLDIDDTDARFTASPLEFKYENMLFNCPGGPDNNGSSVTGVVVGSSSNYFTGDTDSGAQTQNFQLDADGTSGVLVNVSDGQPSLDVDYKATAGAATLSSAVDLSFSETANVSPVDDGSISQ